MDYMTLKEAAEKWGVTPRRVNYYCAGWRIPSAVKMATIWLIPKDAEMSNQFKMVYPMTAVFNLSGYYNAGMVQFLIGVIVLLACVVNCSF